MVKPRTTKSYLADALNLDLVDNEKNIKLVHHDLDKGQQQIKAMHKKIDAIKADEAYQTDTDITDFESQIDSINASIKNTKKTIAKAKSALAELYDQQNNLRAKLRRLK